MELAIRPLGQDPGEPLVEADPLPGEEVVLDRLRQQRVAEGERSAGRLDDEERPVDRLAQRLVQRSVGTVPGELDQLRVDGPADGRDDPERAPRGRVHRGDAGEQQLLDGPGERRGRIDAGRQELLDEERIALRPRRDRVERRGRHVSPPDCAYQVRHVPRVESRQRDARRPPRPPELGEHRARVAAVQLVGPVRRDEQRVAVA